MKIIIVKTQVDILYNMMSKGYGAFTSSVSITDLCFGVKIWPWQRGWVSLVTEEKPADKNHVHFVKYLFPLDAIC